VAGDVADVRCQLVDDEARQRNSSAARTCLRWAEMEVSGDLHGGLGDVDAALDEIEALSAQACANAAKFTTRRISLNGRPRIHARSS
jgi:hypothetical protein